MEFDDLDDLLALEEDLLFDEEEGGGKKRSFQDATSQREAARNLGPAASKRTRTSQTSSGDDGLEDLELLDMVAEGSGKQQHLTTARTAAHSALPADSISATEVQELLELAGLASQPVDGSHQAQLSNRRPGRSIGTLGETEEQELLALVANARPGSQSDAVLGPASVYQGGQRVGPSAQQALQDGVDPELDAAIEELLREDDAMQAQRAQQGMVGAVAPAGHSGRAAAAADPEVIPLRHALPPARSVLSLGSSDYVTVTSQSGERVYCQLLEGPGRAARQAQHAGGVSRVDLTTTLRRCRGRLLSSSIATLLEEVEQDNLKKVLAEAEAAAAAAPTAAEEGAAEPSGRYGQPAGQATAGEKGQSSLWGAKYSPNTFWDLLSDEQVNREVVRWLRGWDPCVFGRPAPPAQQAGPGAAKGPGGQFKAGGGAPDPLARPEHKVILLAGPPGLGKTTLAHVVARQCGYRPVEINASDDRSAAALSSRILDAVEMRAVLGERRPNCVIIDEIDGATGGAEGRSAIAALLKIIQAAPYSKGGQKRGLSGGGSSDNDDAGSDSDGPDEEGEGESGGKEKAQRGMGRGGKGGGSGAAGARRPLRPLLRPIICICNDLYVPALRPLREVARVFHFRKPQMERLVQRLQAVCGWEGLQAEKSVLRSLVERTDCDIRACLNTLQFVAKRCGAGGAVRSSDLVGTQLGQKDMTKGAFAMWQDLLQKKVQRVGVGSRMEGESERHSRLFGSLMDFGEHELVISGIHENVLGLRYFDVGLHRTSSVLNHLGDADRWLRACHRNCDFGMYKYIPTSMLAISQLVAGHERPQLQWPKADSDARRRGAASRALLQGWLLRADPHLYAATGPRAMLLEVFPELMRITSPPLRPVSRHLYSPQEQQALAGLVGTLLAYGLRFAQEGEGEEEDRGLAGQREMVLRGVRPAKTQEPPMRFRPQVHRLCHFPGISPPGRRLPMAIRQLVTHEVDLEAIRRAEAVWHGGSGGTDSMDTSPGLGAPKERDANVTASAPPVKGRTVATLAERLKGAQQQQPGMKKAAAASRRPGTWLDQLKEQRQQRRPRGAAAAQGRGGGCEGGRRGQLPVLYKYHEGYTNAVKRPLQMRDLLA